MKGKTHLVVLVGGVAAAVLIALCAVLLIGSMARLNTAKRNLSGKPSKNWATMSKVCRKTGSQLDVEQQRDVRLR